MICSKDVDKNYKAHLVEQLNAAQHPADNVTAKFENIFNSLKTSAAETVGYRKSNRKAHHTSDPLVVSMTEERHNLLNQLNNNNQDKNTDLKRRLNRLKNDIKKD